MEKENKTERVAFDSARFDPPRRFQIRGKERWLRGEIVCELAVGEIYGVGIALCSADDEWNETTGRRLALTRALTLLHREVDREIWGEVMEKNLLKLERKGKKNAKADS